MTVREMQLDDLSDILLIENENFSVPWTENGFFSFLMRNDTLFLVAEEKGEILGYMGIMMVLDEGEITNVSVAKDARRRGIGRTLVTEMIRRMREKDILTLHLEVRKSNNAAIALYRSMGFAKDGERRLYYEAPAEDAVLMSLSVDKTERDHV